METIKVRATDAGFYLSQRARGDVFEIESNLFSEVWMERVEEPKPKKGDKK